MSRRIACRLSLLAVAAALLVDAAACCLPRRRPRPAPAARHGAASRRRREPPPAAWPGIEGIITDQAGHPLDDVNVEAWRSMTARSDRAGRVRTCDLRRACPTTAATATGYFRLEVPIHAQVRDRLRSTDQGARGPTTPLPAPHRTSPRDGERLDQGSALTQGPHSSASREIARHEAQRSTIQAKLRAGQRSRSRKAGRVLGRRSPCASVGPGRRQGHRARVGGRRKVVATVRRPRATGRAATR